MTGLKFTFSILCATLFLYTSAMAQDDIPSYETTSGSIPGDNTGPETTFSYDLELNADNPNANTFSAATSPVTVTYTITDQPYFVSQDTDPGSADDPSAVMGWNFTGDDDGFTDLIYTGQARDILQSLDAITQSVPASNNFTSLKSVAFLSASPDGDGIDATVNYGANISTSYEGLRGSSDFDTRHDMGTLTVTFSEPVDDPVLHFNGLGGRWFVVVDPDGPDVDVATRTRYYNTSTTDFDIESITGSSVGTPEVLSGTSNFIIDPGAGVGGTDVIRNNSDNPDANSNEDAIASSLTFAVAHGSVLFPGDGITTIVFTMRARFMTARDDLDAGASDTGASLPYDETIYGDTDGLGWAGNTGTNESQTGNEIPDLNFSSDVFVISASIPAPNETLLTGDECFRMLSSPVGGTTYASLLDPIWTQGMTGADYTGGDPNVWLWPTNIDDASSDATDWSAPSDLGNTMSAGSGLLVSVYDDDNYDGTGDGFPKALTVEGGENDPLTFTSMNSTSDGWTLLGNPFKSTIDFDLLFNETNTNNITDAAYVYDRSTSSYASWSEGTQTGDLTGGLIAPFQGFFVQNSATSSQVDFTEGVKSSTAGTFLGKEKEAHDFARFEVNGEDLYNSMWIHFSSQGAIERTRGDALELMPLTNEYAMLGTRKADGTIFDIGHYPIPDEEFEIPVSLETTRPGIFTITATDFDLSIGSDLYFIDLQEQESIRIDENFNYEFSTAGVAAKSGTDMLNRCSIDGPQKAKTFASSDRFMIATQPRDFVEIPSSLALNQNYPNPFNPTTQISYELPQQSDVRLEVYDLVGRQVATLVNQTVEAGAHTVNFDASSLSSGVYIYRLNAGNQVLSRKLTVIK